MAPKAKSPGPPPNDRVIPTTTPASAVASGSSEPPAVSLASSGNVVVPTTSYAATIAATTVRPPTQHPVLVSLASALEKDHHKTCDAIVTLAARLDNTCTQMKELVRCSSANQAVQQEILMRLKNVETQSPAVQDSIKILTATMSSNLDLVLDLIHHLPSAMQALTIPPCTTTVADVDMSPAHSSNEDEDETPQRPSHNKLTAPPPGFVYADEPVSGLLMLFNLTKGEFVPLPSANAATTVASAPAAQVSVIDLKMPQPQKFSGDDSQDVEDSIFTFENYFKGKGTPVSQWPTVALSLLSGSALKAYTAVAQPMTAAGVTPTWAQFKTVLLAFAQHDKHISARRELLHVKQSSGVAEYYRKFQLLVARAGHPQPHDKDLLTMYWNGLSPQAQSSSSIDPLTGSFWSSYKALSDHTLAKLLFPIK
ncbi:hypothetical protein CEUSTIGMA_g6247.t1 [Chlamydomonas eustigma]|uniref:Retrotransposon gag domain-containing protein n=1 Tax=Chlamydomonas eustigma TaxID=1157962 RepID=A0A250X7S2_9CHLO|nr:hypothetical protein CEUSTIGMA_g6247.t1 [Chlamydomonas eustigma]|eukprot:GAX78810.1 hypothetical protein CEUSTIGMA_g6247.t1 [Chlamydomonas eustigma]